MAPSSATDAIERPQLVVRQGRQVSQVRTHQHRDVGGGRHAPGGGTLCQEQLIVGPEPDIEARARATLADRFSVVERRHGGTAEGQFQQVLQQRGLTELALGRQRLEAILGL